MLDEDKKVPEVLDAQIQTEFLSLDEKMETFEELQDESGND